MNFESFSRDVPRYLVVIWILTTFVSFCLQAPHALADDEYVLNEMASTRSGVAYSVHVLEDYALVTGNNGVSVFDVRDADEPRLVSLLELSDGAFDLHLDGWLAYIAADEEGLFIVNFSDPARPEILGSLNPEGVSFDISFEDHHAYVADNSNGLRIVDVSDPTAPVEVGTYRVDDLRAVEVREGLAYLAVPNSGLMIVDVTDPSSPSGARVVPGTYATINLRLSGDYLYLSCHGRGTKILDVSDPLDPEIIGTWSITGGESYSAYDYGDLLFVADLQKGAILLDIGDPSDPQQLARYGTQPHDVFYDGENAYLACESGLVILQYGPLDPDHNGNTFNNLILPAAVALVGGTLIFWYLRSRRAF